MLSVDSIHCGDCLEIMPQIDNNSVDLILCDLPYQVTHNFWDSQIPLDMLFSQYIRVLKPNGAIVLFATQPFTTKLISSQINIYK